MEDSHIEKIANAFLNFETIDEFSYIAPLSEIANNNFELTISLYVTDDVGVPAKPIEVTLPAWVNSVQNRRDAFAKLNQLLVGGEKDA